MPVRAVHLLLVGGGGVVVWSGLKGKSVSSVFRQLAGGDAPTGAASANTIASVSTSTGEPASTVAGASNVSGSGNAGSNASSYQSYAFSLFPTYGWGSDQQEPLIELWNKESGWSNTADNPTSGAYGIAQALPSTKYPLAGRPPSEGGSSNAAAQIQWGLSYIKSTYGNPAGAWAHETAYNWY